MSTKKSASVAEKTAQLNELLRWFDSDDFSLEEALDRFTAAEKLARDIEQDLLALKNRIEIVKQDFEQAS